MMRKIFLSLCAIASVLSAGAQGIKFETGTWDAAMAKAKAENKLLFVDFYGDVCPPCRYMENSVFTSVPVACTFNTLYVNYKTNGTKGENLDMALHYGLKAVPFMLWLDHEGNVIHSIVGSRNDYMFLDEVKKVEKSMKHGGVVKMTAAFESGYNDPQFLLDYRGIFPAGDPLRPQIALRYLKASADEVLFDQTHPARIQVRDLIQELDGFDAELFYRMLDGFVGMVNRNVVIDKFFRISVMDTVEKRVNDWLQEAVESGDQRLSTELRAYKTAWDSRLEASK